MGLETATYISGLNASNPINATDVVGEGDDHLRLIKSTLLNTFPSITGPVTATHTELSILEGATLSTAELNILAGVTLTAAQINDAVLASVDSTIAGRKTLTNAPTSSIDPQLLLSDTVAMLSWQQTDAALDEKVWDAIAFGGQFRMRSANDSGLGNVDWLTVNRTVTAIDKITLAGTELEFNGTTFDVNAAADFNASVTITTAAGSPSLGINDGTIGNLLGIVSTSHGYVGTSSAHGFRIATNSADRITLAADGSEIQFDATLLDFNGAADFSSNLTAESWVRSNFVSTATIGSFYAASSQPGFSTYSTNGSANNRYWLDYVSGGSQRLFTVWDDAGTGTATWMTVNRSGATITEVQLDAALLDFNGPIELDTSSASTVGYSGAPSRDISSSTNTAASDMGRTIRITGGTGQTFTLDSDPPEDAVIVIDNATANAWTIAASGTLTWAATGSSGSRTLAGGGMAVALHQGSGNWKISGGGLS